METLYWSGVLISSFLAIYALKSLDKKARLPFLLSLLVLNGILLTKIVQPAPIDLSKHPILLLATTGILLVLSSPKGWIKLVASFISVALFMVDQLAIAAVVMLSSIIGTLYLQRADLRRKATSLFQLHNFHLLFLCWSVLIIGQVCNTYFDQTLNLIATSDTLAILAIYVFAMQLLIPDRKSTGEKVPAPVFSVASVFEQTTARKYAHSNLTEAEINSLSEKVKYWVQEQKLFLRGDFSLEVLATQTGFTKHKLSQFFSAHLQESFNDYVNRKRVDLFKQKIAQNENEQFTLLALAYDSGFQSKSSFNYVFKKFEGLSPRQYAQSIQKGPK